MKFVTTFSKSGYDTYAQGLLNSKENLPGELIYYAEFPLEGSRNLFDIPGCATFLQYIQKTPLAQGKVTTPEGTGYNYNYDAWKFSRKVFAQFDVLKNHLGKVFWVDADCVIKKPIPKEFLEDIFDGKALAYLGRKGFYTETGFVGFDTQHPDFRAFLEKYIECYQRGILFTLKRWHDCEAFDWAMMHSGVEGNNLSEFFRIPPNRQMTLEELDVMNRSVLGEYIEHKKGGKKNPKVPDAKPKDEKQKREVAHKGA